MKKLKIFDFDGVLFKPPQLLIMEMALSGEIPEHVYYRLSMEGGHFTKEMTQEATIKPFYDEFVSRYFSQKISDINRSRLEKEGSLFKLAIASLNNKETISRLLRQSEIDHLFGSVLSREYSSDKKEMLRKLCKEYNPKTEVSFVTDTVYDIQLAREFCVEMDIEVVISGADSKRALLGFVTEDKIIPSYY